MPAETAQKDTPAPVPVARGGRGSSGVYAKISTQDFQYGKDFSEQYQNEVWQERMAAYKGEPRKRYYADANPADAGECHAESVFWLPHAARYSPIFRSPLSSKN